MLALTGGNDREHRGDGMIQDGDNGRILDPFVAASYDAETPARAVEGVEHALRSPLEATQTLDPFAPRKLRVGDSHRSRT